ncbi:fumarylacetoacetase [Platysternon megacephalum]|uniref:Fumarylacetoacetase n=1 Tax=Platysternon megacephalum TaxID=55544 RepID=A0A4D9DK51_9SAUR|nr:fumarylacetoacetase [Platysternon megacephalum]
MGSGLRYPGKVAIVTGGSRGIGEAIVREFVRQGAHVVFCAPEAEGAAGRALEQALRDSGAPGEPHFQPSDVTSERDIQLRTVPPEELPGLGAGSCERRPDLLLLSPLRFLAPGPHCLGNSSPPPPSSSATKLPGGPQPGE